ncbi:MAG: hypothetical protein ISQ32_02100, partial [Rickettsiales bacterium]|nr:hypothetical protein [Rickettsiales bacterium]
NEFDIINNNYANFGALSFVASNQYAGLLGDEVAYSQLKLNLSNKINSYIGFATSAENDSDYIFSKFNYDLGNSYISFSLGTLLENDNFLGTEAEGSFNVNEGSKTTYYGLGYVKNFANNIDFISKLDFGITKIKSDNYSVFKNFSDVSSREASFALVKRYKNSAYGIAYSEPMRVVSGDVLVSVGTARDEDGNVTLASENVSLISSGKERNYELFYKKNLPTNDSISFNFIYTEEPNHIASNPDDQLFALKYSKSF